MDETERISTSKDLRKNIEDRENMKFSKQRLGGEIYLCWTKSKTCAVEESPWGCEQNWKDFTDKQSRKNIVNRSFEDRTSLAKIISHFHGGILVRKKERKKALYKEKKAISGKGIDDCL